MVTIILLALMLVVFGIAAWIIGRHIPAVAITPNFVVNQVAKRESVAGKLIRIFLEQYKLLSVTLATRALRRLKIILLKTDNVASKLLVKIRSYEETLK